MLLVAIGMDKYHLHLRGSVFKFDSHTTFAWELPIKMNYMVQHLLSSIKCKFLQLYRPEKFISLCFKDAWLCQWHPLEKLRRHWRKISLADQQKKTVALLPLPGFLSFL